MCKDAHRQIIEVSMVAFLSTPTACHLVTKSLPQKLSLIMTNLTDYDLLISIIDNAHCNLHAY
jgi:hypothetical protein